MVHHTTFEEQYAPQAEPFAVAADPALRTQHQPAHSTDSGPRLAYRQSLEGVREVEESEVPVDHSQLPRPAELYQSGKPITPPPPRSEPSSTVVSPQKRKSYVPQRHSAHYLPDQNVSPPGRSQSPNSLPQAPKTIVSPFEQPTAFPASFTTAAGATAVSAPQPNRAFLAHRRDVSRDLNFVKPGDGHSHDSLERWKGHPIFHWGVGGSAVTCFPKQIPRYGAGHAIPMIKCSPGEVRLQSLKEIVPLDEALGKFPGPLKAKGKKKELVSWLTSTIELLERESAASDLNSPLTPEHRKRLEEKVLLWKILRVLVEQDGRLEGTPTAEQAVRNVLGRSFENDGAGFAPISSAEPLEAELLNPNAISELRDLLSKGDREKAVWHAVDKRLWSHALLISSTMAPEIRKQVVQEFVRQEVKKLGRNSQPLAVLYDIFAGNFTESVDELVPASARAGFQMVSKNADIGASRNSLDGLDQWQESLLLILSNRTEGDVQALIALGRLLAGYGRVEAAHI